jgi:predicted nucleic acid-binding protein
VRRVFVDTVAWIALLNSRDELHSPARRVMTILRQQKAALVTTEFILLEVADALSSPPLRAKTVVFLDALRQRSTLLILPANSALMAEGWTLYRQRPDKEWGLTDCISFAVMTQEGIAEAFTSDHHFGQAGFVKLL